MGVPAEYNLQNIDISPSEASSQVGGLLYTKHQLFDYGFLSGLVTSHKTQTQIRCSLLLSPCPTFRLHNEKWGNEATIFTQTAAMPLQEVCTVAFLYLHCVCI